MSLRILPYSFRENIFALRSALSASFLDYVYLKECLDSMGKMPSSLNLYVLVYLIALIDLGHLSILYWQSNDIILQIVWLFALAEDTALSDFVKHVEMLCHIQRRFS